MKRISHTAIHEAGHAVLYVLFDQKFEFVEIATRTLDDGVVCLGRVSNDGCEFDLSSNDRAVILWGGIEASRLRHRTSQMEEILGVEMKIISPFNLTDL